MQVIQLHHPYEPTQIPNEEVVMVLGFLTVFTKATKSN